LKIIWVLENIEKNKNFYGKFNILLLLTSTILWKRNHPEDICVLYADDMTIDLLDKLKVLKVWDQIKPLPKQIKVNKSVFWASAKLQVLADQTEPVILMDNDTHVYKPIKSLLDKDTVYVTNFEEGKGYYPTSIDLYVRKLSYKPRWKPKSVNVSFLQLPDPEFTKRYAELSIKLMEEFTVLEAPNPQYLIFAEQLLLRHMMDQEKVKYKPILKNTWECEQKIWAEDDNGGIWNVDESEQFIKHYGPSKRDILDSRKEYSYESEMKHLLNCTNFLNLDLSSIKNR
jgi:hypothetical protein